MDVVGPWQPAEHRQAGKGRAPGLCCGPWNSTHVNDLSCLVPLMMDRRGDMAACIPWWEQASQAERSIATTPAGPLVPGPPHCPPRKAGVRAEAAPGQSPGHRHQAGAQNVACKGYRRRMLRVRAAGALVALSANSTHGNISARHFSWGSAESTLPGRLAPPVRWCTRRQPARPLKVLKQLL